MTSAAVRRPTFSHRAQYAALRGAVGTLDLLGFRGASGMGARLGALGHRPLGIRRAVVERQLRAAFPEWTPARVAQVARAAYESLGRTFVETAVLPSYSRQQVLGLFERVENWEAVERARALGRGLILLTGHIGNWELGGAYIAARGVPLDAVARGMENPLFDAYLTRTRRRIGMHVIHDADAVREVPRALRAGRTVAFLFDQGAVGLASTWVPFFGRMAKTPRGPAVFALRLGAPMVFGVAIRQPGGRFVLSFEPVETVRTGDREADVDAMVAEYTRVLERWVRRAPEQYFWHHRRWKHQRPGTPSELGDPS
ncbi:MAG: lysophospholipid acyltransferase family protein [Gemmatimonadota bacterium]|nr:lysophospholipid acyltransferase family protein [Gemmatimonadota bacterium]MDE3126962.1 lysophospholipid acyltransferase family protein [Gemmatimonadota bacterium]MDE3174424.1 lysophospholipid acyltransferase family protein [Gemmatimonadota bacterium]MDE3214979.1 lysophospholipid acyltransferase family protein [Gemmatimonadota bacterium]